MGCAINYISVEIKNLCFSTCCEVIKFHLDDSVVLSSLCMLCYGASIVDCSKLCNSLSCMLIVNHYQSHLVPHFLVFV